MKVSPRVVVDARGSTNQRITLRSNNSKLIKSASDILDDVLNDDNASLPHRTSGLVPPKTNLRRSQRTLSSALLVEQSNPSPRQEEEEDVHLRRSTNPRRRSHSLDVRVKRRPVEDARPSVASSRRLSTAATSTNRNPTHINHTTTTKTRSNSVAQRRRTSAAPQQQRATARRSVFPSTCIQQQILQLRQDATAEWELFAHTDDDASLEIPADMRIRVVVRPRPLTRAERETHDLDILQPLDYGAYGRVWLYQPRTRVDGTPLMDRLAFCFDNVFDTTATNAELYQRAIRNLIPSFLSGQWASIFAYGQTGSGKTFTMMGAAGSALQRPSMEDSSNFGLYYMAALDIFHALKSPQFAGYSIRLSFFEIYAGKLLDLLNERTLVKCLEDSKGNVCFPGLTQHPVHSADALMRRMQEGAALRSTGTTSRNADSSRSHAVLQLHMYRSNDTEKEFSRLTLIDLAGSERGADTSSASRATRLEGAEINTSLLALKEVIRALATGDAWTHVPFRGSKLTQVLKQSFVGCNCRSVMIACVSPNMANCEPTLNTLRYADRVKERNSETGALAAVKVSTPVRPPVPRTASADLLLDELLSSPPPAMPPSNNEGALEELLATHKDATEVLLDMIQEEMVLVNSAADRHQLDAYMTQCFRLQEEQLAMIMLLREQLRQFRAAAPKDDDSFEDLRD